MRLEKYDLPESISSFVNKRMKEGFDITKNGSLLIWRNGLGKLNYLHKIYGISEIGLINRIERILGNVSAEYMEFMNECNGVHLFDNALAIYGIVNDLSRGSVDNLQPISLETELISSRMTNGLSYPWRPIGSVTGYELVFDLEVDEDGNTRMMSHEFGFREFKSFNCLIETVCAVLDDLVSDSGKVDPSKREEELLKLVLSTQH